MRYSPIASLALVALTAAPAGATTVCPGPNAVWGIDVSEWQGNIDWNKVKAAGKSFAIIRVSDGTGHLDPYFAANWKDAKAAGLIRGAYQFFEPGGDAVAQANLLLQHMGPLQPGDLPPMIDVEATGGQSPQTIANKIHQWINVVQGATGMKPLIYTGTWFWDPNVNSADFASYPLVESWYCNNCCPNLPSPWKSWTMWQYSSSGSVAGIAGNVDLDRFDGTLAELTQLAGGADWAASYVSQSWPLASSPLELVVNQSVPADIVMKNVGQKAWSGKTRLGTTQPRDRASAFATPDWISANRPAGCAAGAAPGANCKFSFNFQAPSKPGDYHEFFGLVEEGVAWFSDNGQGGPPDNQIEAWIHVSEADYHGALVTVSYPGGAVSLVAGQEAEGWVDVKNVGLKTWKAGSTKLAPSPRDKASPLAAGDWLSPTRVSTVARDVAPGEVGRFPLSIFAAKQGTTTQTFGLVEEGVTWFADAPHGGGPADDFVKIHVTALAQPAAADMAGGRADGGTAGGDGGMAEEAPRVAGGCSVAGRRGGGPIGLALLLLLVAAALRRRRAPC
jgi:lysozyme